MNKTILIMLLVGMSGGAAAAWVRVTEAADGFVDYVESATIRKDGKLRRVWSIQDSTRKKGPKGEMSMRALEEYDCAANKVRILSFSSHSGPMANGATINSNNTVSSWVQVPPESVFDKKIRFICAR